MAKFNNLKKLLKIERGFKMIKILVFLIFMLLIINLVNAFGVSSPYWGDTGVGSEPNPLVMAKGETKIINFNLQNNVGNEDETIKVEIIQGKEILKLKKDTFLVKAQTIDTMVPVEVKIPRNATGVYKVELTFKTVTSGESGVVTFGLGAHISFDVIVSEQVFEEKPGFLKIYLSYIIILALILVIIIIATLIILLKRNKKFSKKAKKR